MSTVSLRTQLEEGSDWLTQWAEDQAAGRAAGAPEINVPIAQIETMLDVMATAEDLVRAMSRDSNGTLVSHPLRAALDAFEALP